MNHSRAAVALVVGLSIIFSGCSAAGDAPIPTIPPLPPVSETPSGVPTVMPTATPDLPDWNTIPIRVANIDRNGLLTIADSSGNIRDHYQLDVIENPIIQWAPNGNYLLVSETSYVRNVVLVDLQARTTRKWDQVPENAFRFPEWSPASDNVKFDIYSNQLWTLDIVRRDGTALQTIYEAWPSVNNIPSWGPDGAYLAVAGSPKGRAFHLYIIDTESGTITDATARGIDSAGFGGDWLEDGRLLYKAIKGQGGSYIVLDPSSGESSVLLADPPEGTIYGPKISPSGNRVAYPLQSGKVPLREGNKYSLYVQTLPDQMPEEMWSIDSAIGMYIDSWSPGEDYLMFTVQTEGSGTQNKSYLLDISGKTVIPLEGSPFYLIERKNPFIADINWLDENQFIYERFGDLSTGVTKQVIIYNLNTKVQTEICSYIDFGNCSLWIE